jgi:hypothetical protein
MRLLECTDLGVIQPMTLTHQVAPDNSSAHGPHTTLLDGLVAINGGVNAKAGRKKTASRRSFVLLKQPG